MFASTNQPIGHPLPPSFPSPMAHLVWPSLIDKTLPELWMKLRLGRNLGRFPEVNYHGNGKWTFWRCIPYWKWWFSSLPCWFTGVELFVWKRLYKKNQWSVSFHLSFSVVAYKETYYRRRGDVINVISVKIPSPFGFTGWGCVHHFVVYKIGSSYTMGVHTPTVGSYKIAAHTWVVLMLHVLLEWAYNPFCLKKGIFTSKFYWNRNSNPFCRKGVCNQHPNS